jgi:hypothetical protein
MALQPVNFGHVFSFLIYTHSAGPFGRGISSLQGRYLHTKQHKHRITHIYIHTSSRIRTHDPSVRAGEEGSCLRPRGHCHRLHYPLINPIIWCCIIWATDKALK